MEDLRLSASDAIGFVARANIMTAGSAARDVARAAIDAAIHPDVAVDAVIRSVGISLRHDIETWKNISADANWLEQQSAADTAAEHLGWQLLWLQDVPDLFDKAWQASKNSMQTPLYGVRLWADWYQRRIDGRRTAFDLPIVEDQSMQLRIFTQPNEFWRRGPAIVHDEIRRWLEEAKARVESQKLVGVPLQPTIEPITVEHIEPPLQNQNALVFRTDEDGRIGIDASAGIDELDRGPEAVDRHSEARHEAQELLRIARASNAAGDSSVLASRYLESLGEDLLLCRPGLLIQRGEKLRQDLAMALNPSSDSLDGPRDAKVIAALKALVSAHNLLVGLDPALARRDEARLGPDAMRILVSPQDAKPMIDDAIARNLLLPEAVDALNELTSVTPAKADADNRSSVQFSESIKNLPRKIISYVWNNKTKLVASAVCLVGVARWMLENETWFFKFFADNPNMIKLLNDLFQFLKKLPLN
jgi:hypothetical protein